MRKHIKCKIFFDLKRDAVHLEGYKEIYNTFSLDLNDHGQKVLRLEEKESACKPGSVVDSHSSGTGVATCL